MEAFRDTKPNTFLEDIWPRESDDHLKPGGLIDPFEEQNPGPPGWTEIRRWRVQSLLAISHWGVPLTTFPKAFENMFARRFRSQEYGYEFVIEMVTDRPDIFTIKEPDELSEIIFPDNSRDIILHDARFGLVFEGSSSLPQDIRRFTQNDWDKLNATAWMNRDDDFPTHVVLAGDDYSDYFIHITQATLKSSGIYKATLISVSNPETIYINLMGPESEMVSYLTKEIIQYFQNSDESPDFYRIPEEFLYPNYLCLVYVKYNKAWERCRVVKRGNNCDKVFVEVVVFGGIMKVSTRDLYLMPRKFLATPPQAIPVSLFGIKPVAEKWSKNAASRLRSFSCLEYYLDVLLLPKKSSAVNNLNTEQKPSMKRSRRKSDYDVLICVRNDEDIDLYLDEVLCLENYAKLDPEKKEVLEKYRQELTEAFKSIDRPKNPMVGTFL